MHGFKEPEVIRITASPKEIRALADKMEERAKNVTLGDECFVDFLFYSKDHYVKLYFDQERTKGSPNFREE